MTIGKTHPRAWLLVWAILLLWSGPAQGQVFDPGLVSQEGTQFVTEDPPPQAAPPKPAPPKPAPPPPAAPAPPPPPPAPPVPPPPPARYPTVLLLLDTSDSMLNIVEGKGTTQLDDAKGAIEQMVDSMTPESRLQIWSFNSILQELPLEKGKKGEFIPVGPPDSPARQNIKKQVNSLKTATGTNLYMAVTQAMAIFSQPQDQPLYQSGMRYPVMVVISDGEDWKKSRFTLAQVLEVKKSHPLVTINTIGFHVRENEQWLAELCKIATRPSGCAVAGDRRQLASILAGFYRPPAR